MDMIREDQSYNYRKQYFPFGDKIIRIPDLEKNVLNLKYLNHCNIADFPKTDVSPEFADIVRKIIDGKVLNVDHSKPNPYPSIDDLNELRKNLSEEEKVLMGVTLHRTGIIRSGNAVRDQHTHIKHKKRELKVMLGIRDAGNNSPDMALNILKSARYLKGKGALSAAMHRDIVEALSN